MKPLSERIAERVRGKAACAPHSNRAVILALRTDIQQAFDDGWSVLAVYQTLHDEGRVTFSYQAFRRHVNRLLLGKPEAKKQRPATLKKSVAVSPEKPIQSFTFNPTPNKEDLF